MRLILHSSSLYVLGAAVLIGIALFFLVGVLRTPEQTLVTTTVDRGAVTELVSVSGIVEAESTADLAFPVTGIVTDVLVDEGQPVATGDVLASLASAQLLAERQEAVAALRSAEAELSELQAGPRNEAREVTAQTVQNAESNRERVIREEAEKVENALEIYLSSNLDARSLDADEIATPPTITGTYTCEETGSYTLEPYNISTLNSFTVRVRGLENGSYPGFQDSPGALGQCGLYMEFDATQDYSETAWIVEIPNPRGSTYSANKGAYELALIHQEEAVKAAEESLALTQGEAVLSNSSARSETQIQAESNVAQARARVAIIDAKIADRSIVAPFDGIVTDVTILPGETATAAPVITLLASDAFELTARIPEIDITKIEEGQEAQLVFDARGDELVTAHVTYISPLATEIDGVAYFEATLTFDDIPTWLRAGLNADVDIVIGTHSDVLRIPKRFLVTDGQTYVLVPDKKSSTRKSVTVDFIGNDGYVAISGLAEGDSIIAP